LVGKDAIFIMEATGNYHLNLAHYLHQVGIKVIAENPLKIKRFSQMSLQRTKTDKADAKLIYEYGRIILSSTEPHFWQPDKIEIGHLKQYDTVRYQLIKQRTALSNSEEALNALTHLNDEVTQVLNDMVAAVDKAIKQLDKGMLKLVKEHYSETFDLVTSVPGVGLKTAAATMMICITDGFKKFSHAQVKQFISYIGMSPRSLCAMATFITFSGFPFSDKRSYSVTHCLFFLLAVQLHMYNIDRILLFPILLI
jgi:transposase